MLGFFTQKKPLDTQKPVDPIEAKFLEARKRADIQTSGAQEDVSRTFAEARKTLGARQDVARQQIQEDLARQGASQGGFGGATLKLRQKAIADMERGVSADAASLSAQEAQAKAGLKENAANRELGFGQLAQAGEQFGQQMKFQWAEMDENKKTNFINAIALLKDSGFLDKNMDELNRFWMGGFGGVYPGAPKPLGTSRRVGIGTYAFTPTGGKPELVR